MNMTQACSPCNKMNINEHNDRKSSTFMDMISKARVWGESCHMWQNTWPEDPWSIWLHFWFVWNWLIFLLCFTTSRPPAWGRLQACNAHQCSPRELLECSYAILYPRCLLPQHGGILPPLDDGSSLPGQVQGLVEQIFSSENDAEEPLLRGNSWSVELHGLARWFAVAATGTKWGGCWVALLSHQVPFSRGADNQGLHPRYPPHPLQELPGKSCLQGTWSERKECDSHFPRRSCCSVHALLRSSLAVHVLDLRRQGHIEQYRAFL